MNKSTPPPTIVCTDVPDYYLGKLLYYDDDSDDNCRWVVYDGYNKIRCPTRSAAIDYISKTSLSTNDETRRQLLSARLHLNRAMMALDKAADQSAGVEKLQYARLAVRLRPTLVDIDNNLLNNIST